MPLALELPFGISIDFSFWSTLINLPSDQFRNAIFAIIGWAVLILVFFYMGVELWLKFRQDKLMAGWKWNVLAVDIPPEEIQSPKAVEQIFAHLSGALINPNFGEKYWKGLKQKWFSFEIISIEGYIQFLIYTESQFRDLVEATIYAQYPRAEITEVEDYVSNVSSKFPNDKDDVFLIEYGLTSPDPYPLRTYPEFEHSVTKDFMFNDPMAALLENFTRIGAGENVWMQIILQPTKDTWKEEGIKIVKEIIAQKKPASKEPIISKVLAVPIGLLGEMWEHASGGGGEEKVKEKKKETPPGKVSDLSPGMKDTVASIESKISKVGFHTKIRVLYSARKDNFNPSKCMQGIAGALSQFSFVGRNSIVPKVSTLVYYAFKNYRMSEKKRKYVGAYKKRKMKTGKKPYILNIEELATLWHFPLPLVKTPLLQKTAVKTGEPPINLPTETFENPLKRIGFKTEPVPPPEEEAKKEVPPEELPYG